MIAECRWCGSKHDIDVTDIQVMKWRGGGFIQDVMPNLTAAERELLISGTCDPCFNKMFPEED